MKELEAIAKQLALLQSSMIITPPEVYRKQLAALKERQARILNNNKRRTYER